MNNSEVSLLHSIAEIRDSLICGCDPQIFSAGDHGHDCPIVLFDGLVEQLQSAGKAWTTIRGSEWQSDAAIKDAQQTLDALADQTR